MLSRHCATVHFLLSSSFVLSRSFVCLVAFFSLLDWYPRIMECSSRERTSVRPQEQYSFFDGIMVFEVLSWPFGIYLLFAVWEHHGGSLLVWHIIFWDAPLFLNGCNEWFDWSNLIKYSIVVNYVLLFVLEHVFMRFREFAFVEFVTMI